MLGLVRLFFRPFFWVTGWRWHARSSKAEEHCWLDRGWDEIPEYVVRGGMLIYVIVIVASLATAVAWWLGVA